ncbi:MAG TPA: hypothetical protein PLF35_13935, partial [Prolixibacteraceae bacterium]|nr:hypothetical protein [Prolixibacteraceae bacterium]
MCTDCKKPIKSIKAWVEYALTTAIIALAIMLYPIQVVAQVNPVNVNISVMPPYTSSLYDYINTPNKI